MIIDLLAQRIKELKYEISQRDYEGFEEHEYMYKYKKSQLIEELKEKKALLKKIINKKTPHEG
jgi:hypothetical protein